VYLAKFLNTLAKSFSFHVDISHTYISSEYLLYFRKIYYFYIFFTNNKKKNYFARTLKQISFVHFISFYNT